MTGGPPPTWAPKDGDIIRVDGDEFECDMCDGFDAREMACERAEEAVLARFWGKSVVTGHSCVFFLTKGAEDADRSIFRFEPVETKGRA